MNLESNIFIDFKFHQFSLLFSKIAIMSRCSLLETTFEEFNEDYDLIIIHSLYFYFLIRILLTT
ncbi:hypothetical protein BLOT_013083 [Blomia tropicalis]|nr:hypothetical protein BLOT_013083 [Blomia tropicalis]